MSSESVESSIATLVNELPAALAHLTYITIASQAFNHLSSLDASMSAQLKTAVASTRFSH